MELGHQYREIVDIDTILATPVHVRQSRKALFAQFIY